MRISDVLRHKTGGVATVAPSASVAELVEQLGELGIGAMVVSTDGRTVAGIVSERDVVRHLRTDGADLLGRTVESIMTSSVRTCGPDDAVDDLMRLMTDARIRHVPVVVDDALTGIVSIGDVVKHRISELTSERDHLEAYIHQ